MYKSRSDAERCLRRSGGRLSAGLAMLLMLTLAVAVPVQPGQAQSATKPPAPTRFSHSTTTTTATVTWWPGADNGCPTSSYNVVLSIFNGAQVTTRTVVQPASGKPSTTFTGLTAGTKYQISISAYSNSCSAWSNPRTYNNFTTSVADQLSISVDDVTVIEGDSGETDMVFTVTLSGSPNKRVRVTARAQSRVDVGDTANNAAGSGQDFKGTRQRFAFAANASGAALSQTVIVKVLGDEVEEEDETLTLRLDNLTTSDTRVKLAGGNNALQATGTIIDDDGPPPKPSGLSVRHSETTATVSWVPGTEFTGCATTLFRVTVLTSGTEIARRAVTSQISSNQSITITGLNVDTEYDLVLATYGSSCDRWAEQLQTKFTTWLILPPQVQSPEDAVPVPDTQTVWFRSGSVATPGVYTVDWATVGDCNPAKSSAGVAIVTDPAVGSQSVVVDVPRGVASTATVASPGVRATGFEVDVVTATHCAYDFNVTYVSNLPGDAGKSCAVRVTGVGKSGNEASFKASYSAGLAVGVYNLTVNPDECSDMTTVRVVVGPSQSAGGVASFREPDGAYINSDPTAGAVLASTFRVTATPVDGSAADCRAASAMARVERNDTFTRNDDLVVAHLRVNKGTLPSGSETEGKACHYDITTDLPDGFVAASSGSTHSTLNSYELTPATKLVADGSDSGTAPDVVATSAADCGESVVADLGADNRLGSSDDMKSIVSGPLCLTHNVKVATKDVYITQSVTGDSGGGKARYSLTESKACGVGLASMVELPEGSFNVTRTVLGPTGTEDADGRFRASRFALNHQAEPCVVTVAVSHLPTGCAAAAASQKRDLATDTDATNRAVMQFDITCPAAATAGADMLDDTGTDMLMGPPEDIPTG